MTAKEANGQELALITLDRLDDDLIIAELQGRAVSAWAYIFTQDGQEVTGLSVAGVEQAARETGRHGEAIRVIHHDWRETDDAYYVTVEAGRFYVASDGREVHVDTAIGAKKEAKLKWGKNKGWYTDKFAFEKAFSKAARNAKAKLLDETLKAEVIAMALKEGRYRQVSQADRKATAKSQAKESSTPTAEQVKTEEARRRFFATAGEMTLNTLSEIHDFLGLACKGQGNHKNNDPEACHLLRERIAELGGNADAWDSLTVRLKAGPHSPSNFERSAGQAILDHQAQVTERQQEEWT